MLTSSIVLVMIVNTLTASAPSVALLASALDTGHRVGSMDVAKGPAQVPGGPVCKRRELPTQHTGRSARNVFFGCAFGGQRASRPL